MNDVEEDRGCQQQPRHPVPLHPLELDAHDRQECGEDEHQHRECHYPVKEAGDAIVPRDLRRQPLPLGLEPIDFSLITLLVAREQHVAAMRHEEQEAANERRPEQTPRDVGEDVLTPRAPCPGYEVHSPAPRIARFTRFCISGILEALCRSGAAPRVAISAAILAVSSLRAFPRMAVSTSSRRTGRAATPPTTIRESAMVAPFSERLEATFTSAKSHTWRSRTFSK